MCHIPWLLILAYCPANLSKKNAFWDLLSTIVSNFSGTILGIRDFNSILNQSKNIGGKSFASSSYPNSLNFFMDQHDLADLGFSGPKFTLTNKRSGISHIREMIDRGIANNR